MGVFAQKGGVLGLLCLALCWALWGAPASMALLVALIVLAPRSARAETPSDGRDRKSAHDDSASPLEQERALHALTKQDLLHSVSMVLALLESSDDGVLLVDRSQASVQFNRRLTELWRLPESLGRCGDANTFIEYAQELFPTDCALAGHMRRVLEEDSAPYHGETLTRDGFILEWHSHPQTIDGRHVGRVLSFRDVTQTRKAELALRESEQRYRLLAENVSDVIWTMDADLNFTYVSPSAIRVFKMSAEDMMDRHPSELLSPASYKLLQGTLARALEDERNPDADPDRSYTLEIQEQVSSKATVWLDATITPLRAGGKTVGWIGVTRDITQRKEAEEVRTRLEAQMLRAQKMESLSLLAGGVAHDFNNLLSGILGNASLALDRMPADSPYRRYLDRIENTAMQAAELSRQMLAYSGRGQFVLETLSLSALIRDAAPLLRISAGAKADLRLELDTALPFIQADSEQMRQVVTNLVSNAGDALEDGPGQIEIRTGTTAIDQAFLSQTYIDDALPTGDYVFLAVSDTGKGMDLETQRRIFEPFFTTKFIGRGLGLAAVLGIVRSHHGAIHITSEPGKGTRITVYFPCCLAQESAAKSSSRNARDPLYVVDEIAMTASGELYHAKAGTRPGLVLIAEDEDTVREVATLTVEQLGFSVIATSDGFEAVKAYRDNAEHVVLVIMDLTMPRLNGEQAFAEMMAIRPDVPVLLTTGIAEKDALRRLADPRLAGCVQKPYLPSELSAKVKSVLGET